MKMCNAYSKTNYEENPTLFLEFHGSASSVEEQIGLVKEIALENKAQYAIMDLNNLKLPGPWKMSYDGMKGGAH